MSQENTLKDRRPSESGNGARAGFNASEAALIWALAKFGGLEAIEQGLEHEIAVAIGEVLDALADRERESRETLLKRWAREDTQHTGIEGLLNPSVRRQLQQFLSSLEPHWQPMVRNLLSDFSTGRPEVGLSEPTRIRRDVLEGLWAKYQAEQGVPLRADLVAQEKTFDIARLCAMDSETRIRCFEDIGLYQVAEIVRQQDRRRQARVFREMPERQRQRLGLFLRESRPIRDAELKRIQEVFIAFRKTFKHWGELCRHTGMYFVACSAAYRFEHRMEVLGRHLDASHQVDLYKYLKMVKATSRRDVIPEVRRSLQHYLVAGFGDAFFGSRAETGV